MLQFVRPFDGHAEIIGLFLGELGAYLIEVRSSAKARVRAFHKGRSFRNYHSLVLVIFEVEPVLPN